MVNSWHWRRSKGLDRMESVMILSYNDNVVTCTKPARKFCTSKRAKNTKTRPEKPEKGKTGCVLVAGGSGSGWERIKPGEKTRCLNQNEPHSHATQAKRKPAETQCFRRFCGRGRRTCLGCRLGRAWTQPTGLQAPTTRTAQGRSRASLPSPSTL